MTESNILCAIDRTKLKGALDAIMATASADEARPHLAGVLLETESKGSLVRLVSTDGHRLAKIEFAAFPEYEVTDGSALLPYREVKALIGVLRSKGRALAYPEPVTIAMSGVNRVTFEHVIDGSATVIKAADATFPPYANVIPDYSKNDILTQLQDIANGAEQVSDLADLKRAAKRLGDTVTRSIGWNPRYMADVAKVAKFCANDSSGGVKASFGGPRDPVRIDMSNGEASAVVVIMPMRI